MGNSESQPVRNVDKRTARRDHAARFKGAITTFRGTHLDGLSRADGQEAHPRARALQVAVRRRPIFPHETKAGEFDVLTCGPSPSEIVVHDCRMHADCRRLYIAHHLFKFDQIFSEAASSEDVYYAAASPLVQLAAQSRPATVLMYGQTGSGKTFTMRAIFAAAAAEIFEQVDTKAGDVVTVSYAELGAAGARDMLNGGMAVQMLTDHAGDVQLVPSVELPCVSAEGLLGLIDYASAIRSTAATGVHDASSRSHAICRIGIQRHAMPAGQAGSLTLVDLAGSEQRIDTDKHDARRTKESAHINSSLMSLKDSVRAIANGEEWGQLAGRSALTKLLKPSFTAKDAATLVLATVSPASKDTEHTLNTLRHACVMDGRPSDNKHAWISGGEVSRQEVGEIDVKATIQKRKNETEGGGASGGFGYGGRCDGGIGAAAQAQSNARDEEAAALAKFKRNERKALRLLLESCPEQHAQLVEARGKVHGGPSLNAYQYARLRFRIKEMQEATAAKVEEQAAVVVGECGCTLEVARRALQAAGSGSVAVALELVREADAMKRRNSAGRGRPRQPQAAPQAEPLHDDGDRERSSRRLSAGSGPAEEFMCHGAGVRASGPRAEPIHARGAESAVADDLQQEAPTPPCAAPPRAAPPLAAPVAPDELDSVEAIYRVLQRQFRCNAATIPAGEVGAWASALEKHSAERAPASIALKRAFLQNWLDANSHYAGPEAPEVAATPEPQIPPGREVRHGRRATPPERSGGARPTSLGVGACDFSAPDSTGRGDSHQPPSSGRRVDGGGVAASQPAGRLGRRGSTPSSAGSGRRPASRESRAPWDDEDPSAAVMPSDLYAARREAALQRKRLAEEARRAELLKKVSAKEAAPPSSSQAEERRLQLAIDELPPGPASEATRAGLKKQLATVRAVALREQRKREMAAREAKRAAEADAARQRQEAAQRQQAAAAAAEARVPADARGPFDSTF